MINIPPIRPGDPIRASWLEKLRRAALAALNLRVEAPLELVQTAGGLLLRLAWNPGFWVKVGSRSGSAYAWTHQLPAAGGTWVDGPKSGTPASDPLYEASGSTAVLAGRICYARRAWGTGTLYIQRGACG